MVLGDVGFDHGLAGIGTHEPVVPGHDHPVELFGKFGHGRHIHPVGDIDAAMADINTDSHDQALFVVWLVLDMPVRRRTTAMKSSASGGLGKNASGAGSRPMVGA